MSRLKRIPAERFLQRRGLARLPVDPFAIAASLDIVVQPKPGRGYRASRLAAVATAPHPSDTLSAR